MGDVLASLSVFGHVRVPAPPTFTPSNAGEGELTLDPTDALKDLTGQLVGAEVTVHLAEGLLSGIHLQGLSASWQEQ